jgi:hypothetical protein
MKLRTRSVAGVLSLALMFLLVAAAAMGRSVTPKPGVFDGTAATTGSQGDSKLTVKVSKSGVEVTIALALICELEGQPMPTYTTIASKSFKRNGESPPLTVKDGKFSYKGPIYEGPTTNPGTAEVSGTFKSPAKIVGKASFSWSDVALTPDQSGPCYSGKLTLTAVHG